MANKRNREALMSIQSLAQRGQGKRAIARLPGMRESTVRYHLQRQVAGEVDGRARQRHRAADFTAAIDQLDAGIALRQTLVRVDRYLKH